MRDARRWEFDVMNFVGDEFLQVGLGVRLTITYNALALFVHILTFEVMVQYNRTLR